MSDDDGDVGAIAAGDLDGDGQTDLLLGKEWIGSDENTVGRVYLVRGAMTASRDLADADAQVTATNEDYRFGYSVAAVGDTDADGYDDLLVGAPGRGSTADPGAAWLFPGQRRLRRAVHLGTRG